MFKKTTLLLVVVVCLVDPVLFAQAGVPANITNALRAGGVSLVFNFYDTQSYNPQELYQELPQIYAAGARHVRIPISMDIVESGTSGTLRTNCSLPTPSSGYFANPIGRYPCAQDIVDFVLQAQSQGLVTIVDLHNTNQRTPSGDWNNDYMGGLRDPAVSVRHLNITRALIQYIRARVSSEWFVFQPANEPDFTASDADKAIWYTYQDQLIPSLRAACADCVIFAMPNEWQFPSALVRDLPNLPFWYDPLVIFDLHWYEPPSLTHCTSPGDPNNCAGITWPGIHTSWSGTTEFWNNAKLESLLSPLWLWRDRLGAQVHFSEIGTVYSQEVGQPAVIDESVRAAYLGGLANILRAHNAGFGLFEWHRNFGVKYHPSVLAAVFGAQGTPTSTPSPTRTPTPGLSPTPTNTPEPVRFYRAINLGGAAVTINGNAWQANSGTTPNFTTTGSADCNPWMPLSPPAPTGYAPMITCWREHFAFNTVVSAVVNGSYHVYVYAVQSWNDANAAPYTISLEGASVVTHNPGNVGGVWARLGPFAVNVTDGTLNLTTSGGMAVLSGIEMYTSAPPATMTLTRTPTPSPSPTPTNTLAPVTPTMANTPGSNSFYRGINLGGASVTINGNVWQANSTTTANFTTNASTQCNPWMGLNPVATGAQATMITCWREHWAHNMVLSSVANGQYQVYVTALQSWNDSAALSYIISLEGLDFANYHPGTVGGVWSRLGPFAVNITDGTLNLSTRGGIAVLSGIEMYIGAGAPATYTATRTPTPAVPTNTPTVTRTLAPATPTITPTVTRTPTPAVPTNTPTVTRTLAPATPTITPTATRTPTPVVPTNTPVSPTNTPTLGSAATFYRGINLGGTAIVIDGNAWTASSNAANFSANGTAQCNPWQPLIPVTDTNRTTMIQCGLEHWAHDIVLSEVPNGMYQVSVYGWQTWNDPGVMPFSLLIEGQTVQPNVLLSAAGQWQRMGPYIVMITDGAINVGTVDYIANLSGIEVWSMNTGQIAATLAIEPVVQSLAPTLTPTETASPTATPTLPAPDSETPPPIDA